MSSPQHMSALQLLYGISATINAHNIYKTMEFFGEYAVLKLPCVHREGGYARPQLNGIFTELFIRNVHLRIDFGRAQGFVMRAMVPVTLTLDTDVQHSHTSALQLVLEIDAKRPNTIAYFSLAPLECIE